MVRLLAVHAHPDDEAINNSGLIALASRGDRVTVVTCTRGELGEIIPPDLADLAGDSLAFGAYRGAEIAQAMAALAPPGRPEDGPDQVFLDTLPLPGAGSGEGTVRYHDSGMEWVPGHEGVLARGGPDRPSTAFVDADLDEAAKRLAWLIRDRRVDLLVTYEPGGGYGHPDHVRAHEVAMRAAELAAMVDLDLDGAPAWSVPLIWWTVIPPEVFIAARKALHDGGAALPGPGGVILAPGDPDGPLPALVDSGEVVKIDTGGVLPQRAAALAAHASQIQGVRIYPEADPARADTEAEVVGEYALSNAILLPILRHEYYREAEVPTARVGSGLEVKDHMCALDAKGPTGAPESLISEAAIALGERCGEAVAPRRTAWSWLPRRAGPVALGILAGIYGTLAHRALPVGTSEFPRLGLFVALAVVLLLASFARRLGGQTGLGMSVFALFVVVGFLATVRPGGDVLIAGDTIGYLWILGGTCAGLAVAFFPGGWFERKK